MFADALRDLLHAARTQLRAPQFLVSVFALALAIGATAAVASTADWLLNRSSGGVLDPDGVVVLQVTDEGRPGYGSLGMSFALYEGLREVGEGLSDLAAYAKLVGVVANDVRTDQVVFEYVTGDYFPLLGVRPAAGRLIAPGDDVRGGTAGVVLSFRYWQSAFGGDPSVIDSLIRLNSQTARVIGVAPKAFEGYNTDWNGPTDIWVPMRAGTSLGIGGYLTANTTFFRVVARLAPGVSIEQIRARTETWIQALPRLETSSFNASDFSVTPASQMRIARRSRARDVLEPLRTMGLLILLAACFGTTNSFLDRVLLRNREFAVRTAMGATPGRLARQMIVEAGLLATCATGLGILVGAGLARVLARFTGAYLELPPTAAHLTTASAVDFRMVLVVAAMAFGSALLFALGPTLWALRRPVSVLKDSGPRWGWSRLRLSSRQVVLVAQIGFSVMLAVVAGLYGSSFARIASAESGYGEPEDVLVARIVPRGLTREAGDAFHESLLARLNDLPEVTSAGIGWNPPFLIGYGYASIPGEDEEIYAGSTTASPRYFETWSAPIVQGREFASGEHLGNGVVINTVLADRLWPGRSPVGESMVFGESTYEVIGVVSLDRCREVLAEPHACGWHAFPMGTSSGYLHVRLREGNPYAFIPTLRSIAREINPDVAVAEETAAKDMIGRLTEANRGSAMASAFLAILGIGLLAIGSATLFVSMIRSSLKELAIRVALGSDRGAIVGRIMAQGLFLTLLGTALGVGAAAFLAPRYVEGLYGLTARDPLVFLTVPGVVAAVTMVAVLISAIAHAGANPLEHLKAQ